MGTVEELRAVVVQLVDAYMCAEAEAEADEAMSNLTLIGSLQAALTAAEEMIARMRVAENTLHQEIKRDRAALTQAEHQLALIEADTQRGITDCSTPLFQRVRNIVAALTQAEAEHSADIVQLAREVTTMRAERDAAKAELAEDEARRNGYLCRAHANGRAAMAADVRALLRNATRGYDVCAHVPLDKAFLSQFDALASAPPGHLVVAMHDAEQTIAVANGDGTSPREKALAIRRLLGLPLLGLDTEGGTK